MNLLTERIVEGVDYSEFIEIFNNTWLFTPLSINIMHGLVALYVLIRVLSVIVSVIEDDSVGIIYDLEYLYGLFG